MALPNIAAFHALIDDLTEAEIRAFSTDAMGQKSVSNTLPKPDLAIW